MNTTDAAQFACPSCGRRYDRRPEIAGRKMFCGCGESFAVPPALSVPAAAPLSYSMPPGARERELHDLVYGIEPTRDRIVPLLMLYGGYVLYLAAYAQRFHLNLFAVSAISAVFAVVVAAYAA